MWVIFVGSCIPPSKVFFTILYKNSIGGVLSILSRIRTYQGSVSQIGSQGTSWRIIIVSAPETPRPYLANGADRILFLLDRTVGIASTFGNIGLIRWPKSSMSPKHCSLAKTTPVERKASCHSEHIHLSYWYRPSRPNSSQAYIRSDGWLFGVRYTNTSSIVVQFPCHPRNQHWQPPIFCLDRLR